MGNVEEELGYKPEKQSPESVIEETNKLSSRLLDWMKVKGEVTDGGATETPCSLDGADGQYFYARHFWSIHNLSSGSLNEAMEELRGKFDQRDWEVTKDGPAKNKAKSPEIRAVHQDTGQRVFVVLRSNRSGGNVDLINFIVESRCHEFPDKK